MKKYEFNRNEFEWAEEFYEIIKNKFNLPKWFSSNADALWDMLTGYIETPCEITFTGFNKKENNYNKIIIDQIINCFLDAQKEYPDKFIILMK